MMHPNETLLHAFYQAFQRKDYDAMKACYHPEAEFNDEVFRNLNAREAGMMWEMLIKNGRDLKLEYAEVEAGDTSGQAVWTATYSFSKAKRKVVNTIQASFQFRDGKIIRHTDRFGFYRWARQAFGIPGLLLGWTGWFRARVRAGVKGQLQAYMAARSASGEQL